MPVAPARTARASGHVLAPVAGSSPSGTRVVVGAVVVGATVLVVVGVVVVVGANGVTVGLVAAGPVPTLFTAATVKVTGTPLVSPVTTQVVAVAGDGVHVPPPPITYPVIGEPPSAGAVQLSVTCPSPATAVMFVGASGTVGGTCVSIRAIGRLAAKPGVATKPPEVGSETKTMSTSTSVPMVGSTVSAPTLSESYGPGVAIGEFPPKEVL